VKTFGALNFSAIHKSMWLRSILLGSLFFSWNLTFNAEAAPIKNGVACAPAGATFKQSGTTFVCKKSGTKTTWTAKPKPKATKAVETFVMPRVVGLNLQKAQNLLQMMGSYFMDQTDASGMGRFQLLDSKWHVCAQNPPPGRTVPLSTIVTLASVKLDERCP
jgi:hypothetical protein